MIKWLEVPPCCRVVAVKVWLGPGRGGVDSSGECVDWIMSHLGMRWPGHVGWQSVEIVRMLLWHLVQIMLRLWQVWVDPPRIGRHMLRLWQVRMDPSRIG